MSVKEIKKVLRNTSIIFWAFALMVFLVAGDGFRHANVETESLSPSFSIGEIVDGTEVTQRFTVPADSLTSVSVYAANYSRLNTGVLHLSVTDSENNTIAVAQADIASTPESGFLRFSLEQPLTGHCGETVTLHFTPEGCQPGNAVTFFGGNSVATSRVNVQKEIPEQDLYRFYDQPGAGMLSMKATGQNNLRFYLFYWPIVAVMYAVAAFFAIRTCRAAARGETNILVTFTSLATRYRFLIKQLVARDFKVKYKRSVLGVAWSFLNPLLTMLVQYLVFSTLFKSSVENFPVYLLTGTVFFGFFSEAVNFGMVSIIGNASLIKKVYVPKYIYPVSRVLSSLVNFALAFAPLLLVMVITGTPFRPALLLLLYDVVCFLGFSLGMVLLLSTAVVFFQDVQFLWSVVSMLWMYLTPIFYPESIIPAQYLPLYHLNPLYQYINFARTCIIYGISPHPAAYLGCILPAVVMIGVGVFVFRKQQDKFILYM